MAVISEWDTIAAADRYANRQLRRMEAGTATQALEDRSVGTVSYPPIGPPVLDRSPTYGMRGAGSWAPGMVWQGFGGVAAIASEQAIRLSAVFGCWRLLSDAISTLPIGTYTRDMGVRKYAPPPDYLTFELPQQSRIAYLCQLVISLCADGNAFVATPRNDLGVPLDLIPLQPEMVDPFVRDSRRLFRVQGKEYDEFDIMHIPGMLMPGELRGLSPIRAARDVIDGAMKAQEYGRAFVGNQAVPPAVIEVPDGGSGDPGKERERAQRVAEVWQETHGGSSNAGKVGVLTGGAKLTTIALSPEDAQWLDSKRFGVSEIARFYGVPPHLLADASNSTSWGSGLAEQNAAFGQMSLRPMTERIEEAHTRLLSTHGEKSTFVKLNLDALLRATLAERYKSYEMGISWHFLTPNEARKLEDMPPLPGGDAFPDPAIAGPKPQGQK